ncbi:MAG: hypothetical protein D6812_11230 [Deltaproteobacteria bacterium]|nr:MAG: hypothetical protein D6812_11230 [Deltaproteobacteria bacterium]
MEALLLLPTAPIGACAFAGIPWGCREGSGTEAEAFMTKRIATIHDIAQACLADRREGWRAFVEGYLPLARHLLSRRFPELEETSTLEELFRIARRERGSLFDPAHTTSISPFLLRFGDFVLGEARRRVRPAAPRCSPDRMARYLAPLPRIERQVILLALAGTTLSEIDAIVRVSAQRARGILDAIPTELEEETAIVHAGPGGEAPCLAAIEERRSTECLDDRLHGRVIDGCLTWKAREDFERHIEGCLRCLARFTFYQELVFFQRQLETTPEEVAAILRALDLPEGTEDHGSLRGIRRRLGRWFEGIAGKGMASKGTLRGTK